MRPVDLRPTEEKGARGSSPLGARTGGVPYALIAGLALAVLGAAAWGLNTKSISDKEAELAALEQEERQAAAKAQALGPYAQFRAAQEQRSATVSSLAQSRFDWERVMRELSLVIPSDVWLVELTGTVAPGVTVAEGTEINARQTVAGPALSLIGCASSQDSVASFVNALEDIDGVTRVGVTASERPELSASGGGSEGSDQGDCRTRDFIFRFEMVIGFDEVPAPATAQTAPSVPPAAAPAGDDSLSSAQASAAEQTSEAQQAANILPGGGS
jgi:Tfp pilus assembly protein PilN